jgi:hypothetical protein
VNYPTQPGLYRRRNETWHIHSIGEQVEYDSTWTAWLGTYFATASSAGTCELGMLPVGEWERIDT